MVGCIPGREGGVFQVISTTMTTATMMAVERVDSDQDDDKDPNVEDNDDLIFDTTTILWADAFLAGRGGYFDNDDDGNNNRNDNDKDNGERMMTTTKPPMARTTTTSIFDTTTSNLWSDASWQGGRVILTTMTTATTMAGERVDSDKDDNKDPNGEDTDDLIFDTTTNLWSDAFLAGRGGYFR